MVATAVATCLDIAATWLAWDGRPIVTDGDDLWTPHKALRRVNDHLIDHLAEVEALLAGVPPIPDGWHGRRVTVDADWARFTELDLAEARQRLSRLAQLYELRYAAAGPGSWDVPRAPTGRCARSPPMYPTSPGMPNRSGVSATSPPPHDARSANSVWGSRVDPLMFSRCPGGTRAARTWLSW